jgi:hypothetical protein
MVEARELVRAGSSDAVIIRGTDHSRSDLDRKQRQQILEVYGPGQTFLIGYTRLAERFIESSGMARETFVRCRDAVFENFWRTWTGLHPQAPRPDPRWFEPVSSVFRGVDCANPYVDFSGAVVLASEEAAQICGVERGGVVRVRGAGVEVCGEDGLESVDRIAEYAHLAAVVRKVCAEAEVDLVRAIANGQLLLEIYSCFPVVPIAFLLRSGLVARAEDVPAFLARHPVSVTGGLNLGRAPGNNTTLSALVDVVQRLRRAPPGTVGAVHSLSALGYKQALTVLEM